MNGLMKTYEIEYTLDERVTLVIGELTERDRAAKVTIAVGIASGTAQRTFAGDFNGKHRRTSKQDLAPGLQQLAKPEPRGRI